MEDGPLAGHWKKLVAWGMIIENGRQPTVHPLVATYLEQGWPVEYGSFTNVIAFPNYETPTAPSNGTSNASKKRNISAITRRDIYRTHPNCRTFIAFIYDPDGYIDNAIGFERDLSNTPGDIRVKVIVAPR